jgi:hypothetical protein
MNSPGGACAKRNQTRPRPPTTSGCIAQTTAGVYFNFGRRCRPDPDPFYFQGRVNSGPSHVFDPPSAGPFESAQRADLNGDPYQNCCSGPIAGPPCCDALHLPTHHTLLDPWGPAARSDPPMFHLRSSWCLLHPPCSLRSFWRLSWSLRVSSGALGVSWILQ